MANSIPPCCASAAPRVILAQRLKDGSWQDIEDMLSPEELVQVSWAEEDKPFSLCRIWAWPEDLAPLALGHVLLDHAHPAMRSDEPQALRGLRHTGRVLENGPRSFTVEAKAIARAEESFPAPVSGSRLLEAMTEFMAEESLWNKTGCFHRAGLYDSRAHKLIHRAEDIGRHNCIDRLAGYAVMNKLEPSGYILLLSSRITASLYAKAQRAGFFYMAASSAVTSAAVDLAASQGVTLVGFARTGERRLTVFADSRGGVLTT